MHIVWWAVILAVLFYIGWVHPEPKRKGKSRVHQRGKQRWVENPTPLTNLNKYQQFMRCGVSMSSDYQSVLRSAVASRQHKSVMKRWLRGIDYYSSIEEGYTPPIKDQGDCGSCVAFGVVAAIEIQYRKKYGEFVNLSEGDLYFCSGYRTCGTGWLIPWGLDAAKNGVAYESERPYRDSDDEGYMVCHLDTHHLIGVQTHQHLVDIDMIQEAIVRDGAVVASLAIYEDFYSYGGGTYYHSWGELCGFHCVTIVGYNDGAGYWICRNSWGSHWGMSGYFSIGYLECGIDDDIHSLEIFKLS